MKRKVNRVGQNTLTISLPSNFVKKYGIKQGSELEVEEAPNKLIIKITSENKPQSIKINYSDSDFKAVETHKDLWRTIVGSLYKVGYDEIEVYSNSEFDEKLIQTLQKRLELLAGLEIIEKSKNRILIKNIFKIDFDEYDRLKRKYFQIICVQIKEFLQKVEDNSLPSLDDIKEFRLILEKTHDSLCRILIKNQNNTDIKKILEYQILTNIEKIGREYIHLMNHIIKSSNSIKVSKVTLDYFKSTNQYFEKYYTHYYSFELKDLNKMATLKNELLYDKGYEILQKAPKKELVIIHHLMNIVRRTWDIEHPLLGIVLEN